MRKQTKVLAAAALFTLGASFSAFAAKTGTWALEDGEWFCYNSDGDAYENEWCYSNGQEYYVGDDGRLVCNEWVEDDSNYYFTNSAGQKVKNEWRFLTPYDEEDEDEEWFYFKSNGKMATDEKLVIGGKTYFFNEDGVMLTGWVQLEDKHYFEGEKAISSENVTTFYCNEDGARVSKEWIYTYAPTVDEEDAEDDDYNWYWIKSNGNPATTKQSSVNGNTYFFSKDGVMLTGWVAASASGATEIWVEDEKFASNLNVFVNDGHDIYFCGNEDDGHVKKNRWFETYPNTTYGLDDSDEDMYWYYAQSNGKVFVATVTDAPTAANRYKLMDVTAAQNEEGDISTDARFEKKASYMAVEVKKLNGKYYLFDQDGRMSYGFVEMDDEVYYYGGSSDGARKDGSFTVTDDNGETVKCYFATDDNESAGYYNNAGVNGAKNGKLYAFGVLVKAEDAKYEMKTVDDMKFIVNKSGSIQSDSGVYKEDGAELFDSQKFEYVTTKGVTYHSIKED